MVALLCSALLATIALIVLFLFNEILTRFAKASLALLACGLLLAGVLLYPYANLWQKGLAGQAVLAEAEYSRRVKVMEAQATLDSAKMLADAEIARARGIAGANKIVADGLGGPAGYLRYLSIEAQKEANRDGNKVIYIPTEAGIPITEAGRVARPQ